MKQKLHVTRIEERYNFNAHRLEYWAVFGVTLRTDMWLVTQSIIGWSWL